MSSRTAAARKRQEQPPPKVSPPERSVNQPKSFTSTTRSDLISSTPPSKDAPRMHTRLQRLDLSTEFTQSLPAPELPSPEYSHTYVPPSNHVNFSIESNQAAEAVPSYGPFPHLKSNHKRPKWIESGPTYEPSSPYEENIYQSRRYQHSPRALPPLPIPGVPSLNPISPATGSFPYVPDLPTAPKYPPASTNKHSDHLAASYIPCSPSLCRSDHHSLTPSDLPEYRSTYSYHMDSHIPVAITNKSTRRDNQHTSYQLPSASLPSPHAQLAASSISPLRNERRPPFRYLPSAPDSINHSSSSSNHSSSNHSSHGRRRDSASLSGFSGLSSSSPSTPTSNGTWQPPAPPPSPKFFFPNSRSVAHPRVTPKFTISQLKECRSKSRLRAGRSWTSSLSSTSPSADQETFETAPVSPIQSNHPGILFNEVALVLSDDYKRKAPPEKIVYPTSRSRAQPKISSKPRSSKSSSHSKSKDDNSGRFPVIEALFKKNKGKTPKITLMDTKLSDSVASTAEHTPPGKRIPEGSSHELEFTAHTRKLKSRSRSYPLDPYNSVLLDNDRHTGELLSLLNRTGSPSFHDYGTTPPSSVLDLGCGQGHWVLEAAIAWKAHGTLVTGYDMVNISKNLLSWAAEQGGVQDNIRFVQGNFLKEPLPFSNNTFDLVRMSCLALCITSDSWDFILHEAYRVLVAGGRLEFIDDQIFFPYGKVSSLMDIRVDDTNSKVESVAPKLDSFLSPSVTTFNIYDEFPNPGLGSAVGHLGHDDDGSDHDGSVVVLHDHTGKGKVAARLSTAQPRVKPPIVLSPEAWDRSLSISEDLEALFDDMLLDTFDIQKDPSDFILSLMKEVFGQAREVETMNLLLALPDSTAKSGHSPQQGLSHCPGLILWPSTFIPMDQTEVEIHASKHLRTLLSCKNFLAQYAIEVADDERVDEEFVSEALWEYESFLRHRFNPPVPSSEISDEKSDTTSIHDSTVESTPSESFESMLEMQSEIRQRYSWQPKRPPNTLNNTQDDSMVRTSNRPVFAPSAPGSSVMRNEVTHVRTFRVFEAVKTTMS